MAAIQGPRGKHWLYSPRHIRTSALSADDHWGNLHPLSLRFPQSLWRIYHQFLFWRLRYVLRPGSVDPESTRRNYAAGNRRAAECDFGSYHCRYLRRFLNGADLLYEDNHSE